MKTCYRMILGLAVLLWCGESALGQTTPDEHYREWVEYRNGEISFDFDQTPITFALHAIHAKTGFQIVIPSPGQARVLNLRLQRQPFEPAIRSLISTIGYQSFALLYDDSGRPSRAVVLGAESVPVKVSEPTAKAEVSKGALNIEEQDKLQKDLTRWHELKQEERRRIENRLKELEPSEEREMLISEYGKQLLRLAK